MVAPGTRIGPYEVASALGAGGMGEVYRARDAKLNRDVAIKVLLPAVADDPDRLARFSREAQVLASLNHPNIAHIHGLEDSHGVRALVMELVEGPTLADRIAQGPIPLDEALPIARQIAEALEAAHEQGIIHRDLKPANIKVRDDGTVKVLDFGLAKLNDPNVSNVSNVSNASNVSNDPNDPNARLSLSPTITSPAMMTGAGMILGTAAYMSPEQARGKAVDKRADIWAFGVVLYEMLTGRRPFEGEDVTDVLARVLERQPDLQALPPSTPPAIRALVRRCLEKDRKRRLPDIGVARLEIDEALAAPSGNVAVPVPAPARTPQMERLLWAAAVLTGVALASGVTILMRPTPADAPEMRLQIVTPESGSTTFAISPDGQHVVYSGGGRLWIRPLASEEARPLEGADGGVSPFWSPDGQSIGFAQGQLLKRLPRAGGPPQTIASTEDYGATWGADGIIVFSPANSSALLKVAATGGTPVEATRLGPGQVGHRLPHFLPDGRRFLFFVTGAPDVQGVYIGSLDSTGATRLLASETRAVFARPDYVLFGREEALFAQRIDFENLKPVGEPRPLAERLALGGTSADAALSASFAGPVAYRTPAETPRQLIWFDRSGKQIGVLGEPDPALAGLSLSPDGRTAATSRRLNGNGDIWLSDVARGVATRFTANPASDSNAVWSPDGSRIAFHSARRGLGRFDLYVADVASPGSETVLLESPENKNISDWSSDGRFILYTSRAASDDLWALPLDGDRRPFPLTQTSFDESFARFSSDGRWIAYLSNETGRAEVYVRPFPGTGRAVRISLEGGGRPAWSADGREVFFFAPGGRSLMAVRVTPQQAGFDVSAPARLFTAPAPVGGFDVSRDGRFLLNLPLREDTTPPITILLNWAEARGR